MKKNILNTALLFVLILMISSCSSKKDGPHQQGITIENPEFRLVIGTNGKAISLKHKPSGQECLEQGVDLPVFSLTQSRPYNNELQLAYPAKSKTFAADSVYRSGDDLIVRFELIHILAVISLKITDDYIGFSLKKFDYEAPPFGKHWELNTPVDEFTLLQLPVRDRDNFGEWLNVVWDKDVAVNVLGTDPYAKIDNVKCKGYHLLTAEAVSEVKTLGVGAALIATKTNMLLNRIDQVEKDYNLPGGVKSRRNEAYKYSYLEVSDINPQNVDEYIAFARKGGFHAIEISWMSFAETLGHFPWRPEYPNGMSDLQEVVGKIKQAGIIPGFHIHYNKVQKTDLYVSPVPDHRLNLSRMFTLASPLDQKSTTITVEETPEGCTLNEGRRILKLGNELIEYANYTTSRPYQFTGCMRGTLNSHPSAYGLGYKFGLLDVDTWPIFIRFDQKTSIQQEMAERIGKIYREAGFEFVYFDGAEDIPIPYWFNTSKAQLEVYNCLEPKPLFAEGACKSHFSWHILTRGNAFDVFKPEVIKEATREHPVAEALLVAKDFTSINFGWIDYLVPGKTTIGMQPDMFEYVCSRAAAWNCPIALRGNEQNLKAHPRTNDNLEVIRRWEEARIHNFFTEKQKEELKNLKQEYILLTDESGNFELQPYEQLVNIAGSSTEIRAFIFNRKGKIWVVYWHTNGEGHLVFKANPEQVQLFREPGQPLPVEHEKNRITVPAGDRLYLEFGLPKSEVIQTLKEAKLLD